MEVVIEVFKKNDGWMVYVKQMLGLVYSKCHFYYLFRITDLDPRRFLNFLQKRRIKFLKFLDNINCFHFFVFQIKQLKFGINKTGLRPV